MREFTYTITDPLGLHARPAGLLVKQASLFTSKVRLFSGEQEADCQRLLSVMKLCVKQNSPLRFLIEGEDEEETHQALETFCREKL